MLKQRVTQNVAISLAYFIFSKSHNWHPKVAQLPKNPQSGHPASLQKLATVKREFTLRHRRRRRNQFYNSWHLVSPAGFIFRRFSTTEESTLVPVPDLPVTFLFLHVVPQPRGSKEGRQKKDIAFPVYARVIGKLSWIDTHCVTLPSCGPLAPAATLSASCIPVANVTKHFSFVADALAK
jgi:hypothetical protein